MTPRPNRLPAWQDFSDIVELADSELVGTRFQFTYFCRGALKKHVASYDGNALLTGCTWGNREHTVVAVAIDMKRINMRPGCSDPIHVVREFWIADSSFPDGFRNKVVEEDLWPEENAPTTYSTVVINALRGLSAYDLYIQQGGNLSLQDWLAQGGYTQEVMQMINNLVANLRETLGLDVAQAIQAAHQAMVDEADRAADQAQAAAQSAQDAAQSAQAAADSVQAAADLATEQATAQAQNAAQSAQEAQAVAAASQQAATDAAAAAVQADAKFTQISQALAGLDPSQSPSDAIAAEAATRAAADTTMRADLDKLRLKTDPISSIDNSCDIDLTEYEEVSAWINTSNKWSTSYKGIFIPVMTGQTIELTGNATGQGAYAFLKNNVVGSNSTSVNTFATGATRKALAASESVTVTAPSDAGYLWIGSSVDATNDRLPQRVRVIDIKEMSAATTEESIDNLRCTLTGETLLVEGSVKFKNASSYSSSHSTRIFTAPEDGDYTVRLHMNDGVSVASGKTSGTRIFGVRALRYTDGVAANVHGYDYTYSVKGDELATAETYAFDLATTDYELPFMLLKGDIVFVIDRLSGSATYEVVRTCSTRSLEVVSEELGERGIVLPVTLTSVSSFSLLEGVRICKVALSGRYRLSLTMQPGWTTTAVFSTSSKTNAFSFRIYDGEYLEGGQMIDQRNYMLKDYEGSTMHYYEFNSRIVWELDLVAGQIVYFISRIDGTGVIKLDPLSSVAEQMNLLSDRLGEDEDISPNDVETNKLDGDIWLLEKKLAANPTPNMILAFFSDIHGDLNNARRVVAFCDHYNIGCIVHGGDSVADYFNNGNGIPDNISTRVMNVVGNHDSTNNSSDAFLNNVSDADLYNTFIAPFASSVVLPANAASSGLCYWYKDFAENGVRIIGINCMRWTAVQSSWLVSVLADALEHSLGVIIVSHYPADDINGFDTPFNSRQWSPAYKDRTLYLHGTGVLGIVDDFINDGGEFICYLTGHQHRDHVGTCSHAANVQVQITIDSSSVDRSASGIYQTEKGKNSIDFDILAIDRYEKSIRVVRVGRSLDRWARKMERMAIDYINGCLYNRYNLI